MPDLVVQLSHFFELEVEGVNVGDYAVEVWEKERVVGVGIVFCELWFMGGWMCSCRQRK